MLLENIKQLLDSKSILFSEDKICNRPTVIGYDKRFKWRWFATQLNTFIMVSDFASIMITEEVIEEFLAQSFKYAISNYHGWPRGLQSGLGVIAVLLSENINDDAIRYCKELKSGKKWAGFTIPVTMNASNNQVYSFDKNPVWGRIYYPHFRCLIKELTDEIK